MLLSLLFISIFEHFNNDKRKNHLKQEDEGLIYIACKEFLEIDKKIN